MDSGRSARVGVAFVILLFSLLGVLPPVVASVRRQKRGGVDTAAVHGAISAPTLRVKAFAAGIMLSLSVVHVCYDAFAELSAIEAEQRYPLYNGYPMAGPFIVLGILGCVSACCACARVLGRARTARTRGGARARACQALVDVDTDAEGAVLRR
jgi:hypothetical protein